MVKFVAFLSRKSDMSQADFVNYYENVHIKLIGELLPVLYSAYRRNYVDTGNLPGFAHLEPDCDVITEMEFNSNDSYKKHFASATVPSIAAAIIRDEENVIDRIKIRAFTVTVYGSCAR